MTHSKCDLSNPDFEFSYCPTYGAAVLFAVLFSITTAGHFYQAYRYRKPFAGVLIMGGLWEVLGYAIRTASIHNPLSSGPYIAQLLLILLAPLWINAFLYMLVGRMIHFFLDDDRVFGLRARRLTLIFVVFDITAFVIQCTGGSMTSGTNRNTVQTGLHVYTVGVALQIIFNIVFLAIIIKFQILAPQTTKADSMWLLRLVYCTLGLILLRNFYRLAEFASGVNNTIIRHEWYQFVFDAVPILAAMIVLNIWHPARKLQGQRCDFSDEDAARKLAKKERKAAKQLGTQEESKLNTIMYHQVARGSQLTQGSDSNV